MEGATFQTGWLGTLSKYLRAKSEVRLHPWQISHLDQSTTLFSYEGAGRGLLEPQYSAQKTIL